MHLLPPQVTMEVHLNDIESFMKKGDIKHFLEIFKVLFDSGYAVFDNRMGDGGCEISFIKFDYRSDSWTHSPQSKKEKKSPRSEFVNEGKIR